MKTKFISIILLASLASPLCAHANEAGTHKLVDQSNFFTAGALVFTASGVALTGGFVSAAQPLLGFATIDLAVLTTVMVIVYPDFNEATKNVLSPKQAKLVLHMKSDAMAFIASDGKDATPLFQEVLRRAHANVPSTVTDLEIARVVAALSIQPVQHPAQQKEK